MLAKTGLINLNWGNLTLLAQVWNNLLRCIFESLFAASHSFKTLLNIISLHRIALAINRFSRITKRVLKQHK